MTPILPDFVNAELSADIVDPSANALVIFDTINSSRLNRGLAYSTSTGIITIKAGCTAIIRAWVEYAHSAVFAAECVIYDRTGAAEVSAHGRVTAPAASTGVTAHVSAIVSPTVDTTYDIRTVVITAGADVNEVGTGLSIVMFG
jgi:hypothetical protein